MEIKEIILNNVKVLKEYKIAKKIKNGYLESSSSRSNVSRKDLPRIDTIIELCEAFNLDATDFVTKLLKLKLVFEDVEEDYDKD